VARCRKKRKMLHVAGRCRPTFVAIGQVKVICFSERNHHSMNWFQKIWQPRKESAPGDEVTVEPRYITHNPPEAMNFTPRAQQVLALARSEANRFNHNFVGTEHVLLGLVALGQGTAVTVLRKLGLDLENVRTEVERQVGTGPDQKMVCNIPYTPRVKKVLNLATKEATALNHTYVGTEHILLGLLREGDGVAARVLQNMEVNVEQIRQAILNELDPNFSCREGAKPSSADEDISMLPSRTSIDTVKRYDVYCTERDREVVYRNARFRSVRTLFQSNPYDFRSEFLELEQENGEIIFLARFSLIKFCEHAARSQD